MPEIRIGTSGFHYEHWRGPFYPADLPAAQMLAFYSARFDTVEINNSFYRLPEPRVLESWRRGTPARFEFAAKASRYLTHMKKLKDPEEGLGNFMPRIESLGPKLGPILFQLPPHWALNLERLEQFLAALPAKHRYAFEFRDPSWHVKPVYDLLGKHGVAFCAFELAGHRSPIELTASFAYVRLHGPGGPYQGSYDDAALRTWARRIRKWTGDGRDVFVYFDNDQSAFAPHNALTLRAMLGTSTEAATRQCGLRLRA